MYICLIADGPNVGWYRLRNHDLISIISLCQILLCIAYVVSERKLHRTCLTSIHASWRYLSY
jgi:hypothetical protein